MNKQTLIVIRYMDKDGQSIVSFNSTVSLSDVVNCQAAKELQWASDVLLILNFGLRLDVGFITSWMLTQWYLLLHLVFWGFFSFISMFHLINIWVYICVSLLFYVTLSYSFRRCSIHTVKSQARIFIRHFSSMSIRRYLTGFNVSRKLAFILQTALIRLHILLFKP